MIKRDMAHFAKVTSSTVPFAESVNEQAQRSVLFNSALKNALEKSKPAEQSEKINAVIMGRKTWDSIPAKFRPLKDRLNVVLTKSPEEFLKNQGELVAENLVVMDDLEKALTKVSADHNINEIFVMGGSSLYQACFEQLAEHVKMVIATRINKKFECDTFVPSLEAKESKFTPVHIS